MNIIKIKYLGEYQYQCWFKNGEVRIMDLKKFLKSSHHYLIKKYLDKNLFAQAYLDKRGAICWGDNEMDINPMSIFNNEFAPKKAVKVQ